MTSALLLEAAPTGVALACCRSLLAKRQLRIAFGGRAGAGKNTVAELVAGGLWPVYNHADTMKEEVLEWVVDAVLHGLDPESEDAFVHFADFLGISPGRIRADLWELIGPVYASFVGLYLGVRRERLPLAPFVALAPGTALREKVAFVDAHKPLFRSALQRYGQMSKEIAADPDYWVQRTVARSLGSPVCLNADTRFPTEASLLRACAWSVVYLQIDDETQRARRPEMTEAQRRDPSEWALGPEHCDVTIDANGPLGGVLMALADYLSTPSARKATR